MSESVRYSNKRTSHQISKQNAVGFNALSKTIGSDIMEQILTHDDGQLGYGGTRTFAIGGQGGGKSTFCTKFGLQARYIDGASKNDFFEAVNSFDRLSEDTRLDLIKTLQGMIKNETVIWRGREFDSWNILNPELAKLYYPAERIRPLKVHVHRNSPLKFLQVDKDGNSSPIPNLDINFYKNVKELADGIITGGTNVIYPPIKHFMSPRLKDEINMKRNLSHADRRFLSPTEDYLVERDVFLFEIFEYLYRTNQESKSREWYTAVIDESHDLFRANAPDIYYWIIECMVDVLVDTRKHNISLACMTHALNLIDYRILERTSHFIWLPGAKPSKSYSNVDRRLVLKLKTGQAVPESVMDGKIGGFEFERIPAECPRLTVEGMVNTKDIIAMDDDDFVGVGDDS
jgi:hypothetical protein